MYIEFSNNSLSKLANSEKKLKSKFSHENARLIQTILQDIEASADLDELKLLHSSLHQLSKSKTIPSGSYGIALNDGIRIIIQPYQKNHDTIVLVIDIRDYHKVRKR